MFDFLSDKSIFEQTYWIIAIISSIIFVIIFLLTFFGGDADADLDTDISDFEIDDGGVGFQFFTFKSLVAFFTIFGWTGLSCIQSEMSAFTTLVLSSLAGLIMMFITSALFYWIYKMVQSGTLKINNAVGQVGEVYLPIGAKRSKMGKVHIKVQGSLRELEALTDSDIDLPTGSIIKVVEVISAELLLVEKLT